MIISLNILKCDYQEDTSTVELVRLLSKDEYTEILNTTSWYDNIVEEDGIVSGEFYFKNFSYIHQLIAETNSMEKVKTEVINSVRFVADIKQSLLEYYGSTKDYSRFRRDLSGRIGYLKSIENPTIDLEVFYKNAIKANEHIELKKVSIPEFVWDEKLIGKFDAKVMSGQMETDIMTTFKNNLSSISFLYPFYDYEISITVNKFGRYRINCLEKDILTIVNFLKTTQKLSYA